MPYSILVEVVLVPYFDLLGLRKREEVVFPTWAEVDVPSPEATKK